MPFQVPTRHNAVGDPGAIVTRDMQAGGATAPQQPDYGGLAVSPNSDYLFMILGKRGEVRVLDVRNPSDITSVATLPLPAHGVKTGEPMGVAIKGNDIFTAAGILGLRVYNFPGFTD